MTRALLLAIGLVIAAPIGAASTTGSIAASLTIFSRCDISRPNTQSLPAIDCGRQVSAQPRVMHSTLEHNERSQLVTVEW